MNEKENSEGSTFRKRALEYLISPEKLYVLFITVPIKYLFLYLGLAVLFISFLLWSFFGSIPVLVEGLGVAITSDGLWSVSARDKGIVKEIFVRQGDTVDANALVAIIENKNLKKRVEVRNRLKGIAYEVLVAKGEFVDAGEPLIKLEGTKEVIFLGFFEFTQAIGLKEGLPVKIELINSSKDEVSGTIKEVSPFLISPKTIELIIPNKGLAEFLGQGHSGLVQVRIEIEEMEEKDVESGSIGVIKGVGSRMNFYAWLRSRF